MTVATLRLDLRLEHCTTLREQRRRMQAFMEKVHRSFNVSVAAAEPGRDADPSLGMLAVVAVSRSRREARALLRQVADAVAAYPRAELLGHEITEV